MPWRKTLLGRLNAPLAALAASIDRAHAERLTEIRVRSGQRTRFVFMDECMELGAPFSQEQIDELISALCGYARYAYESQMAQGYIPLPGGHRAGVCGRAVYEDGKIARMSGISSICIRIARCAAGASAPFRSHLLLQGHPTRLLVLGPPGSGKTTALRDAAQYLAGLGWYVAAADEREELFSSQEGSGVDVLWGADKADGMAMLLRSMSPQVMVCDEIGSMKDARALLSAASSGVGLLASAHGSSMKDVLRRPALRMLFERKTFERYILLNTFYEVAGVWDEQGRAMAEERHGELGCSGDSDDRNQRNRFSDCGRRSAPVEMGSSHAALPFAHDRSHTL